MDSSGIDKSAEHWDQYWSQDTAQRGLWLLHPFIQKRLHQLRGDRGLDDWFVETCFAGRLAARGLGIGSGASMFELLLVQRGVVAAYDLYDISGGALEQARETARRFGIEGRVRFFHDDINHADIADRTYDLVTFISSLHHMTDLEGVLRRVHAALTPGGMVFADEYIGPDRFNFPDRHTEFVRHLYKVLDGDLKGPTADLALPTPELVQATDPTEAVHSEDIVDAMRRVFGGVEITPMQNTLPFIMWGSLSHDALFDTAKGRDLVRLLIELDDLLIGRGSLPDYFALLAARKAEVAPPVGRKRWTGWFRVR